MDDATNELMRNVQEAGRKKSEQKESVDFVKRTEGKIKIGLITLLETAHPEVFGNSPAGSLDAQAVKNRLSKLHEVKLVLDAVVFMGGAAASAEYSRQASGFIQAQEKTAGQQQDWDTYFIAQKARRELASLEQGRQRRSSEHHFTQMRQVDQVLSSLDAFVPQATAYLRQHERPQIESANPSNARKLNEANPDATTENDFNNNIRAEVAASDILAMGNKDYGLWHMHTYFDLEMSRLQSDINRDPANQQAHAQLLEAQRVKATLPPIRH